MSIEAKGLRVLVTGATGAIGPLLVNRLMHDGYRVNVLVRGKSNIVDLSGSKINIFRGDITDRCVIGDAIKDVEYVYHLAALLHINKPDRSMREEYERINVHGTRVLADAALEAGVKRMVYFSTVNVYGPGKEGVTFNEDSPLNPIDYYAETKALAEEVMQNALPSVVLRPAAVYGSRMKGNYKIMLEMIKKRHFVPIGRGNNRRSLIFEDDLIEAALTALTHPNAVGNIYNVSDGEIHSLREIIGSIYKALNRKEPLLAFPLPVTRAAAGLADFSLQIVGKELKLKNLVDKYTEDMAVSADKILAELDFKSEFDLKKGWQETVKRIYRRQDANVI